MKLKEKFSSLLPFYNVNDNNNKSTKCEQIADDYAIEFANWCVEKELFNTIRYERITTKQLLEIFKKEKGL